jgi:hypothetical protein
VINIFYYLINPKVIKTIKTLKTGLNI